MSEGGTEERVRKVHVHEYLSKENLQGAAAGIHGMVVNLDSPAFQKLLFAVPPGSFQQYSVRVKDIRMAFTAKSCVCQENKKSGEGLVNCSDLGIVLVPLLGWIKQRRMEMGNSPGCEHWFTAWGVKWGEVQVRKRKQRCGKILMI